jgi:hypothetical protein
MKQVLLALLLFISSTCFAGNLETDISVGQAIHRGQTPALDLTFREPAFGAHQWHWQESLTVVDRSEWRGVTQQTNIIVRGLLDYDWHGFTIGGGGSYMAKTLPYNGSHENFSLELGYRWKHLVITYAHQSNAGLSAHNEGRDVLMIGWRF